MNVGAQTVSAGIAGLCLYIRGRAKTVFMISPEYLLLENSWRSIRGIIVTHPVAICMAGP